VFNLFSHDCVLCIFQIDLRDQSVYVLWSITNLYNTLYKTDLSPSLFAQQLRWPSAEPTLWEASYRQLQQLDDYVTRRDVISSQVGASLSCLTASVISYIEVTMNRTLWSSGFCMDQYISIISWSSLSCCESWRYVDAATRRYNANYACSATSTNDWRRQHGGSDDRSLVWATVIEDSLGRGSRQTVSQPYWCGRVSLPRHHQQHDHHQQQQQQRRRTLTTLEWFAPVVRRRKLRRARDLLFTPLGLALLDL